MDSLTPNISNYNPFLNKKKGAPFNQEQLNYIKELVDRNWSVSKIVRYLHLSSRGTSQAIKRRIKENDWIATPRKRSYSLSQKELNEMKREVEQGESVETLSKKYNVSIESIENRILNNNWEKPKRKPKYYFNENYFDEIDTEHKAYWLGFFYADGYITQPHEERQAPQFGFEVSTRDKELLIQFQKDLETNAPIHVYKKEKSTYKHNYPMGRISISSRHLVNSLAKWGVIPNKTYFIKFPDFLSEDLLWAFLRGYSDGDGTIFYTYGKYLTWELCGTKEFLEGLLHFLNKDLKISQRWPERDVNNYQVSIRDSQGEILSKLYKNATIFLNRKYQKFAEMQGKND